ncbi:hypothetical protein PR048_031861, partial [Dryococelus australis]
MYFTSVMDVEHSAKTFLSSGYLPEQVFKYLSENFFNGVYNITISARHKSQTSNSGWLKKKLFKKHVRNCKSDSSKQKLFL